MTTPQLPCLSCIHYRGLLKCDAFPDKIPDKILVWEHDHRKPFKDDQGIQFEPIPELPIQP